MILNSFSNSSNPSRGTVALGMSQPLTEMSTGRIGRPLSVADNLTTIWEQTAEKMETLTPHKPVGLHGLLQGLP
jgi:hypothetical protein